MIKISDITKKISSDFIIKANDFTFERGKTYFLSGKNGSGKSTLLKILLGIVGYDSGIIKKNGSSISGFLGIVRMVDFLTPKEYFLISGKSYGLKKREVFERYNFINSFFHRKYLDENKKISDYSDGNKQLIGLFAACIPNSDFLILDEPFNYLDRNTPLALIEMLEDLQNLTGVSIIYSDNSDSLEFKECIKIHIIDGFMHLPTA